MPIKINGSTSGYTEIKAPDTAPNNTLTLPSTSGTLMTTGGSNTFTANQVIEVTDNSNAALRITQLGTGEAIRVEDTSNPDSTPFIVDASGKVGIGISAPANNLDVVGGTYFRGAAAAGAVFTIAPDATSGVNGVSLDTGYLSGGSGPLIFKNTGVERMRIAADGTLYVNSANINMQTSDSGLCWGDFSTAVIGNAVSDYVKIITAGTEKFSVDSGGRLNSQATYDNTATGSTVVVTSTGALRRTSSSIKYKKDVETLDHALVDNAVANLRPVWYRTKNAEGDDKALWSHIGLISEEVDLVEKRLVRYKTAEVTYDENGNKVETPLETPEPEDVDYARLSVLLLDKVQRMDATIKALETRIATLENA